MCALRRLGQRHARRRAAGGLLERPQQRRSSSQPTSGRAGARRAARSSRGRGTGCQLAGDDRLRHDPALRRRRRGRGLGRRGLLGGRLHAGGRSISRLSARPRRRRGVLGEQREQRGVPRGGPGQRRRRARRSASAARCAAVAAVEPALTRARSSRTQQRDGLEFRTDRGARATALTTLPRPRGRPRRARRRRRPARRGRPGPARGVVRRAPVWRWPGRATNSSSGMPDTVAARATTDGSATMRSRRPTASSPARCLDDASLRRPPGWARRRAGEGPVNTPRSHPLPFDAVPCVNAGGDAEDISRSPASRDQATKPAAGNRSRAARWAAAVPRAPSRLGRAPWRSDRSRESPAGCTGGAPSGAWRHRCPRGPVGAPAAHRGVGRHRHLRDDAGGGAGRRRAARRPRESEARHRARDRPGLPGRRPRAAAVGALHRGGVVPVDVPPLRRPPRAGRRRPLRRRDAGVRAARRARPGDAPAHRGRDRGLLHPGPAAAAA